MVVVSVLNCLEKSTKALLIVTETYNRCNTTQDGNFTSASQSDQRALAIRIKLFGEEHESTVDSYSQLGVTQNQMGK